MEEFKELDQLFKEGLQNAQMTPPPGVWESIAASGAVSTTGAAATTTGWILVAKWIGGGIAALAVSVVAYKIYHNDSGNADVKKDGQTALAPVVREDHKSTSRNNESAGETLADKSTQGSLPKSLTQRNDEISGEAGPTQEIGTGGVADPVIQNPVNEDPVVKPNPRVTDPVRFAESGPNPEPVKPTAVKVPCIHTMSIVVGEPTSFGYTAAVEHASGSVTWDYGQGKVESGSSMSLAIPVPENYPGLKRIKAWVYNAGTGCLDSAVWGAQPSWFNVFTPNGDGKNEEFKVYNAENAEFFDLIILDAFKNRVFSTTDPKKSWDGNRYGNPLPAGQYTMLLQYRMPGENAVTKKTELITLTR